MSKPLSLKEEADKLMRIKGNTKGTEFLTLAKYIRQKYGEEKLHLLERKLKELGYPLVFDEIKPIDWYKESLNVLAFIVAKNLFGWKDLFEVGYDSPKLSIGVQLFMKFISPKRVFKEGSKTWSKFTDVGILEPYEYNEKEKYVIIRLRDFKLHPEMCRYYAGFLLRILQYTQKSKETSIEESKCMFKGDSYHEYVMRW